MKSELEVLFGIRERVIAAEREIGVIFNNKLIDSMIDDEFAETEEFLGAEL